MSARKEKVHPDRWLEEWWSQNIDATIDQACKAALAADVKCSKDQAAHARARVRQRREKPMPIVERRPVIQSIIRCTVCNSDDHWASQCTLPKALQITDELVSLSFPVVPEEPKQELVEAKPAAAEPAPVQASAPPTKADGRRKTAAGTLIRRQRLNELLEQEPGADPMMLMAKLREEFGRGLDGRYVYATCRIARELHQLPQLASKPYVERNYPHKEALPTFDAPEEEDETPTLEEEARYLAQQLADLARAHGVTSFDLALSADGEITWDYSVMRTGKGSMKLGG